MRMGEIEIHDYARQLLEAHGEMAVVEAAQKARSFEENGQTEEAETWRGIEAARFRLDLARRLLPRPATLLVLAGLAAAAVLDVRFLVLG